MLHWSWYHFVFSTFFLAGNASATGASYDLSKGHSKCSEQSFCLHCIWTFYSHFLQSLSIHPHQDSSCNQPIQQLFIIPASITRIWIIFVSYTKKSYSADTDAGLVNLNAWLALSWSVDTWYSTFCSATVLQYVRHTNSGFLALSSLFGFLFWSVLAFFSDHWKRKKAYSVKLCQQFIFVSVCFGNLTSLGPASKSLFISVSASFSRCLSITSITSDSD